MQPLLMTELLRASAKFKPDGAPMDPARAHLRELREKMKLEAKLRKPISGRGQMQKKLSGLLTALHLRTGVRIAEQ